MARRRRCSFLFMGLFRLIRARRASAVGGFIGRKIFSRSHVSGRARQNLAAAFPEKSEAEIEAIVARDVGQSRPHRRRISPSGQVPHQRRGPAHRRRGRRTCAGCARSRQGRDLLLRPFRQLGDHADRRRPITASKARSSIARLNNPFVDRWIVAPAHQKRPQGSASPRARRARGASSRCCASGKSIFDPRRSEDQRGHPRAVLRPHGDDDAGAGGRSRSSSVRCCCRCRTNASAARTSA